MKFHLKVNCIIGGAPGEPGSPGGAVPGGDLGFGGGGFGGQSSNDDRSKINTMFNLNPALVLMQGLLYGGSSLFGRGLTFGDIAQGDPGGGYAGAGGGPTDFLAPSTMTQKALAKPVAPPPIPPPLPVVPKPIQKKKRVGRQETILTSALSDAPTLKPTLLGQ